MHLVVTLAMIYALIFHGNTVYAKTTVLEPSHMIFSLTQQILFVQFFMYLLFAIAMNFTNEWLQGAIFKAIWQDYDIYAGMLSVPFAMLLGMLFLNKVLFIISLLIIATALLYNLNLVYKKFKGKISITSSIFKKFK